MSEHHSAAGKVFGIGLSKTGTTSLAVALKKLGYRAKHFPYLVMRNSSRVAWLKAQVNGRVRPLFKDITRGTRNRLVLDRREVDRWEALTDTPIARFHRELDVMYPGSKFIYTTRDMESWLRSCEKFFFPTRYDYWLYAQLHHDLYGTTVFDRARFAAGYRRHDEAVRAYFSGREADLLVLDICGGDDDDNWQKLCTFLGHDVPDGSSFPHHYKSAEAVATARPCKKC